MAERDYFRVDYGGREFRPSFWATYPGTKGLLIGLIGLHVIASVVHASSVGASDFLVSTFWLSSESVLQRYQVWQLVTYSLFHFPGVMHLLFNCIGIFFFGRMVEERLNLKQFTYFCIGCAVVAAFAYMAQSLLMLRGGGILVGASGIDFGLITLGALWFPHRKVLFMFIFQMPMWVLGLGLVLIEFIRMTGPGGGGIAHSAHLGGALYAFIYWKWGGGFGRIFGAIDEMAEKRKQQKAEKTAAREAELRKEVDRILDKVNREGMSALSEQEKKFLKDASDQLRR